MVVSLYTVLMEYAKITIIHLLQSRWQHKITNTQKDNLQIHKHVNTCLTFPLPGQVFKLQFTVYKELIIWTEKHEIKKYKWHFVENKTQIMQHVLKMQ